jgi:hypothetical protein
MESLALLVSILLFFSFSIGFVAYGISFLKIVPNFVVWIFGFISIFVGVFLTTLPIGINVLGLLPLFLGITAIRRRME